MGSELHRIVPRKRNGQIVGTVSGRQRQQMSWSAVVQPVAHHHGLHRDRRIAIHGEKRPGQDNLPRVLALARGSVGSGDVHRCVRVEIPVALTLNFEMFRREIGLHFECGVERHFDATIRVFE